MVILGINAYHGDASAAIVVDGQLIAAVEEERFTRVKHTAGFPAHAVRYCLEAAGVRIQEVDHIAIPRNPKARWFRKIWYAARLPRFAIDRVRAWTRFQDLPRALADALETDPKTIRAQIHRVEHHLAHLASSFYVSPFERAALLSLDGLGDFASGMWGIGEGSRIRTFGSVAFPHSVGLYYTAWTQYLGFWKYGDEYKVMGLAAYGEPEYLEDFREMLRLRGLGYQMDLRYFQHHTTGPTMTWEEGPPRLSPLYSRTMERRFGPARPPDATIEPRHMNLAATLQKRLEEVVLSLARVLHHRIAEENGSLRSLAYAGGVAFNCVANGQLLEQTPFEALYIQPAAGDAGLAVGAAFYVYHHVLGYPRQFAMEHAYWGPAYSETEIQRALERSDLPYRRWEDPVLIRKVAQAIAEGKVVGWYQGRTEWGPRALGNRSILVDPRRPEMKDLLNRRIKHREPFRPFAPSILEEYTHQYFESTAPSPFMLLAYRVRPGKRSEIPATIHVDGTARIQTVHRSTNPRYWQLIEEFRKLTGVPVVLNTSFNENEPIVNTPQEAVECFLRTQMDLLAIGPYVVERTR